MAPSPSRPPRLALNTSYNSANMVYDNFSRTFDFFAYCFPRIMMTWWNEIPHTGLTQAHEQPGLQGPWLGFSQFNYPQKEQHKIVVQRLLI